jgi:hypothetical protein
MSTPETSTKASSPRSLATSASPELPTPATHRRTGKIARLPRKDRDLLNLMLRDGIPYAKIVRKLADHGHSINEDQLSRWFSGGYQEWVQEQAWLDEMRARLDFANEILTQPNADRIDAASLRIAVTQMYSLLLSFDPLTLKNQLSTQPSAYSRLLSTLCKITDSLVRSERRRVSGHPLFSGPLFPVAPEPPSSAS